VLLTREGVSEAGHAGTLCMTDADSGRRVTVRYDAANALRLHERQRRIGH
jgi:hypothetical protein